LFDSGFNDQYRESLKSWFKSLIDKK
jgi:hypothetical protein